MDKISLKQVYFGGITMQIPEIWDIDTEEMIEADGHKSVSLCIAANGQDVRSIDISYGHMPDGSDAYLEACGTYEEVMEEEDLSTSDEPILSFEFQNSEAYGFSLSTEDGLPCFFFCKEIKGKDAVKLLTVLLCASGNEDLQSLLEYTEEYLMLD